METENSLMNNNYKKRVKIDEKYNNFMNTFQRENNNCLLNLSVNQLIQKLNSNGKRKERTKNNTFQEEEEINSFNLEKVEIEKKNKEIFKLDLEIIELEEKNEGNEKIIRKNERLNLRIKQKEKEIKLNMPILENKINVKKQNSIEIERKILISNEKNIELQKNIKFYQNELKEKNKLFENFQNETEEKLEKKRKELKELISANALLNARVFQNNNEELNSTLNIKDLEEKIEYLNKDISKQKNECEYLEDLEKEMNFTNEEIIGILNSEKEEICQKIEKIEIATKEIEEKSKNEIKIANQIYNQKLEKMKINVEENEKIINELKILIENLEKEKNELKNELENKKNIHENEINELMEEAKLISEEIENKKVNCLENKEKLKDIWKKKEELEQKNEEEKEILIKKQLEIEKYQNKISEEFHLEEIKGESLNLYLKNNKLL